MKFLSLENYSHWKKLCPCNRWKVYTTIEMKIRNLEILEELELSFENYSYGGSNILFS